MWWIALALAAQQAASAPAADIVVTGRRAQEALDKCLARRCPPEEEVEAAMAAGAEGFANGRYEEAKKLLRSAIGRNKRHAAKMPVKMANLYATYADVAEHEGDEFAVRHATIASVDVLREHLGEGSPTTLAAAQRIGDMLMRIGPASAADGAYAKAAERARAAGAVRPAAMLELRRAWLAASVGDPGRAGRLIKAVRGTSGGDRWIESMAQGIELRIALATKDDARADALLAKLRGAPGQSPILMKSPAYAMPPSAQDQPDFAPSGEVDLTSKMSARPSASIQWADIGFWVRPDGRTEGVEVLRPMQGAGWTRPILNQIAQRNYAPIAGGGETGVYRVERFTLRPSWIFDTGSRIRVRKGRVTLHVIDITRLTDRAASSP